MKTTRGALSLGAEFIALTFFQIVAVEIRVKHPHQLPTKLCQPRRFLCLEFPFPLQHRCRGILFTLPLRRFALRVASRRSSGFLAFGHEGYSKIGQLKTALCSITGTVSMNMATENFKAQSEKSVVEDWPFRQQSGWFSPPGNRPTIPAPVHCHPWTGSRWPSRCRGGRCAWSGC